MKIPAIRQYNQKFSGLNPQKIVKPDKIKITGTAVNNQEFVKKVDIARKIKEASERVAQKYADPEYREMRRQRALKNPGIEERIKKLLTPSYKMFHIPIDI